MLYVNQGCVSEIRVLVSTLEKSQDSVFKVLVLNTRVLVFPVECLSLGLSLKTLSHHSWHLPLKR